MRLLPAFKNPFALGAIAIGAAIAAGIGLSQFLHLPDAGETAAASPSAAQHLRIAETDALTVRFPAPMRAESAAIRFTVEPPTEGNIEWPDARTMAFRPSAPLILSGTYTMNIAAEAERRDGAVLGTAITRTFFVAGSPRVSQAIPPPEADRVERTQPITIVFDRSMAPLTAIEEQKRLFADWPVTITPVLEGSWRWLSTTTAEFTPRDGLAPATRYAVSIPAGISSVQGSATAEPFAWNFTTSRPFVKTSEPPDRFTKSGPKTEIVLQFNQPVDLSSVIAHTTLLRSVTGDPLKSDALGRVRESNLSPDIAVPVAFRAVRGEQENTVVLIPEQPLLFDNWYAVIVDDGVLSPGGSLGSEKPFTAQFRTAGAMETTVVRQEYGHIIIGFSNPYDAATAKEAIRITPEPDGWGELDIGENPWEDTALTLYLGLSPSTEYAVAVTDQLRDIFGQPLATPDTTFPVRPPPLTPRVFIHSNGTFGVFERDVPPVQYVNAVNVSRVDVSFAKISLEEFLTDQRMQNQDWQYVPPLAGRAMYRSWSFPMDTAENEWKVTPLDLEEQLGQSLPSGIYAFTVTAPEYREEYDTSQQITKKIAFTLSRTALTLKVSGGQALVWAVDMKTGAPVADAEITLHDLNGKDVASGRTDGRGIFETRVSAAAFAVDGNTWNPDIWVTMQTADDFAFVGSNWQSGIYPNDFGIGENWQPEGDKSEILSHLFTDRPIYRTSDTVHFKGILRLKDPTGLLHPPAEGRRIHVRVYDANDNTVYGETFSANAYGSFDGSVPLDAEAALGTYGVIMEFEDDGDIVYNSAMTTFEVLAYRKPEFRAEITFDDDAAFDGDTVRADIAGSYYFGMPMDGARVQWRAALTDYFFNRVEGDWYSFSLEDAWCWYDCARETEPIADGEGVLAADGTLRFEIPVDLQEKALSQVLSVDADIEDESNQVVSTRASVPVHKAGVYVGIKPMDYAVRPGEEAGFALITVDPKGTPMPNREIELTLFRRTWNTTRKKGVDGAFYFDNEPTDRKADSFSVRTGADGKATTAVRIPSGGQFRLLAQARDDGGRGAAADASVYAWSDTYINWPHSNSNRMTVTANAPAYAVGDTATLLAQSPYQGSGVTALVTVEREEIISRSVIPVTSAAQPIEIPVTEEMIPNAYVSVVIVKPRVGETFDDNGLDTGAPAFRIGYAKLKVENASKALTVSIQPEKRRYLPGEEVEVTLLTQDWRGNPVPAEVSLSVVDMSVLALTGFRVPDLLALFYGDRGLGVRTAQNLLFLLERYKPGSKGGGGGDLEERARGDFKDTAYWNPSIVTDAGGRAVARFTLPDNLTTWQILATGHTRESLVGAFATEILETKRVIVRPVRPRFAVHGDRAELAAIVVNGTEEDAAFAVTLGGAGFKADDTEESVTVPAGEQRKVTFPVVFDDASAKADFVFAAEGADARDEVRESVPLVSFGVPRAVATSGFTEDAAAEERFFVPVREEVTGARAELTLSPTLATYLPKGLEFLVRFPYGCAEQTVSSFLPNIAVAELQGLGAFRIVSPESLREKVTAGMERLLTFQRPDGGFGYFPGSRESYPYLSAYVLHAFRLAANAGYAADERAMLRTREYLRSTLRSHRMENRTDLAERAYILYVLGETGTPDQALLSNLYGKRDELGVFAKAYLAMALERSGDHRRSADLLQDILAAAKISPRGTHFEEKNERQYRRLMSTNQRTTAVVLQALLRIDPQNALIPNVVRGLLAMRQGGHWDTTQSTTAGIFSLVEYLRATRELEGDFKATASVNGEEVNEAAFNAANILTRETADLPQDAMSHGQMNALVLSREGTGRLYYDLLLTYFWKTERIDPLESGISIAREIQPVKGSAAHPTVGSTYKVKLTITVPEERHFVGIESPHPAGMEGVDFALKTTQQYLQEEMDNGRADRSWWNWWDQSWYFTHREFRDDQVFLFADNLPAGVYRYEYLVRATLSGTFRWRPARASEMYFPEVFGNTAGETMKIGDAP